MRIPLSGRDRQLRTSRRGTSQERGSASEARGKRRDRNGWGGRSRRRHRPPAGRLGTPGRRVRPRRRRAPASWPTSSATATLAVGGDVTDDDDVGAAIDAARSLGPLSVLVNVAGGGVGGGRTVVARRHPARQGVVRRHDGDERRRDLQRDPTGDRGHGRQRARRRRPTRRGGEHGVDRRHGGQERAGRLQRGQGGHPRHDPAAGPRPGPDGHPGVRHRPRAPWAPRSC